MASRIPMTREGYDKLKADLDRMEGVEMMELAKRVADARALGDLSENAEYHAAREDHAMLKARIDALKEKLGMAEIIDRSSLPSDTVVFGTLVRIKDIESGQEVEYQLVGPGEEDYEHNKILTTSPRGKALLGKKVGDTAVVQIPRGTFKYKIMKISLPD